MESSFVSQETFDEIITQYVTNIPECKQEKALINLQNKIHFTNPSNANLCNKNTRDWAKKRFRLEEITLVILEIHADVDRHGDRKQLWISVSEKWGWVRQSIVEKFVNNCMICAVRKPSFHPLAANPIITKTFLS
ncbi:retrotransposon nucleocapsid protein [Gigaspora margarita]|uniref:Retrotransposon nucleocapsid protein n=1 Tax=Gigaspora margarita TaxID=4874 RepID=A0A8H4B335_GIGMA|nr:retrotransposon nucleocapsid protein [Gigaspora margarita]